MNHDRTANGPGAAEETMAKDEQTLSMRGNPQGAEPLAWLEDIESPEEALPAWVLAKIDRTVERYGRRWTDAQTAAFRRQMAWTLATHPNVRRLVQIVEDGQRARGTAHER